MKKRTFSWILGIAIVMLSWLAMFGEASAQPIMTGFHVVKHATVAGTVGTFYVAGDLAADAERQSSLMAAAGDKYLSATDTCTGKASLLKLSFSSQASNGLTRPHLGGYKDRPCWSA